MNIKKEAKRILSQMSLEEKIGQVTQLSFNGQPISEMAEIIHTIKPGSFILCGSALGGSEQQREVCLEAINELQRIAIEETENKIPLLFGRDVVHGHRVAFPVPLTMAASFDFDYIEKCYDSIREEAINDGVKWTFTPMLDMSRDHRWGRIVEGPGEDPYIGECFARAVVKGFQTENLSNEKSMLACAKHFVGYGASEGGRDYNITDISDYSMQNYYLPAFRAAVESGAATVMSSFNTINGVPASGDKHILTELLRDQLGFEGFVVSDWGAIEQMNTNSGYAETKSEAATLALKAGVDMDMYDNFYLDNIADLIKENKISESDLDIAVLRILETKLRAGLFEHPYVNRENYNIQEHLKLSQTLAEKSIVLLKNKNGILPLSKKTKVGVCGPMLRNETELVGTWSLDFDADYSHNIIDCLSDNFNIVELTENSEYKTILLNNIEASIVVLGESKKVTGEATGLVDVGIPKSQLELVKNVKKSGKPVIGVFCFARPISFGEYDYLFDAIIYAGHGGSRAAEAITAILCGDAEPEGRLPFTLPYTIGQLPLYYNALPGSRRMNGYYNDVYPHHHSYCDSTGSPNYPFGFGLSYTDFSFSSVNCAKCEISLEEIENGATFDFTVTVSNIGKRFGVAVPQLYVRDLFGKRLRPLRALRKTCKVSLFPNESKDVIFNLSIKDLGYYLEDGSFILEKGDFDIFIGENCLTENSIRITVK